jgi:hypothetical protein
MTEYEYLEWLIQDRYHLEIETSVNPIGDRINAELKGNRNFERIAQLEHLSSETCQNIWEAQLRGLDILHWLKLDSELRANGLPSYPDFMERESTVSMTYSNDLEEF